MDEWSIDILRMPTDDDWNRCLMLARATQGNFDEKKPTAAWKNKILRSEHSPIRTLMFTIKMNNIPYCNSVHFVRHKFGVEHYVQSQRKEIDRGAARQDSPVTHIMDINMQELIFMAHKRLCQKADPVTREIMKAICKEIEDRESETYCGFLVPACGYNERNCREFKPCGCYPVNRDTSLDYYLKPLAQPLV